MHHGLRNVVARVAADEFDELAALELNVSCPNVTGGVDYGTDPAKTYAASGAYTVTLSVRDPGGLESNVATVTITMGTKTKTVSVNALGKINLQ